MKTTFYKLHASKAQNNRVFSWSIRCPVVSISVIWISSCFTCYCFFQLFYLMLSFSCSTSSICWSLQLSFMWQRAFYLVCLLYRFQLLYMYMLQFIACCWNLIYLIGLFVLSFQSYLLEFSFVLSEKEFLVVLFVVKVFNCSSRQRLFCCFVSHKVFCCSICYIWKNVFSCSICHTIFVCSICRIILLISFIELSVVALLFF